ncbi:unnamed protein product [Prunus armeniaca]
MAGSGGECSDSKGADESDAKKKEKEESSDAGKMTLIEVFMKDAKALGLIQGAVFDGIFPRISHEDTSKGAWDILMQEFHADKQISPLEIKVLRIKRIGRQKGKPKCYNYDKFGHLARDYYSKKPEKSKKPVQRLKYATQDVRYIDSGCSNYMTGKEDLLVDIDKNVTAKVEMGTGQLVEVTSKENLVVETKIGKRYIKEVILVPGLKKKLT